MKSRGLFQISIAICFLAILITACGSATATPDANAPKPSKPGGTGKALTLTGNIENGKRLFDNSCSECHGVEGKEGVTNEGAKDGSVPTLNPIDPGLANSDPKVFAANIDLFIEHGSTPEGDNPTRVMPGFGDLKMLEPQDIADVIAYVISLNKQ